MLKFYFTFGSDPTYPYYGGWVEVYADSYDEARQKFRKRFGLSSNGLLPFAFQYTTEQFMTTAMARVGNMGYFCHEVIS